MSMWNEPHSLYGWNLERSEMKGEDMKIDDSYWYGYKEGKRDGFNKAIDDFAEKIADWCDFCNGGMRKECVKDSKCKIYEIAEQLKGGV